MRVLCVYKAVYMEGGGDMGGHVLRETTFIVSVCRRKLVFFLRERTKISNEGSNALRAHPPESGAGRCAPPADGYGSFQLRSRLQCGALGA